MTNILFNIRPYTYGPHMLDSVTQSRNLEKYISQSAIRFVREVFRYGINTCGNLHNIYVIMTDYFNYILAPD